MIAGAGIRVAITANRTMPPPIPLAPVMKKPTKLIATNEIDANVSRFSGSKSNDYVLE